jgi:hypothetical protein
MRWGHLDVVRSPFIMHGFNYNGQKELDCRCQGAHTYIVIVAALWGYHWMHLHMLSL